MSTTIRVRAFLFSGGVLLSIVVLFSQIWLPKVFDTLTRMQISHAERQMNMLSNALVPYLLQNQIGAVHEVLLEARNTYPEWASLELRNEDRLRIYPVVAPSDVAGPDIHLLALDISFHGYALGELRIALDTSQQSDRLREQIFHLGLLIVTALGVMIVVLLFGLDRLVLRRINVIAHAARKLSEGDYAARLPRNNGDELGPLTDSFSVMRNTIRSKEQSLIQARDVAEQAAEVKARFLATMSHEIRTPLNGVLPVTELLLESALTPEQRDQVETISSSGKALKSVIDDILDMSKIDAGEIAIRHDAFCPADIVDSVTSILRIPAGNRGIKLETQISEPALGTFLGDGDRLRQVLLNLAGNALKFTDEGMVKISVVCVGSTHDRKMMKFSVMDTGIGISEEDQDRVFQRFAQVDNLRNRRFQGSGLGLAISVSLVEAMGGTLELDSLEGKGSTFWFVLPVEIADAPMTTYNHSAPFKIKDVDRPLRILIVDDSKVNQKVAQAMLRSMGHEPILTDTGPQAIARASVGDIDLILMDQHMPGMDGLETTRIIRRLPGDAGQVTISGLTASAFEEDVQNCLNAGMNDFMSKPISRQKLEVMIGKWHDRKAAKVDVPTQGFSR